MTVIATRLNDVRAVALRFPALLSLLLGAVAATGFAPLEWWPVTLLCFAAWMWLIFQATRLKTALWRGWLFGLAHFTLDNNWIQHAFTFQDAMPHWLGYLAVVLLAGYLAVYPALAAALAWRFRRGGTPDAGYVLIFAAAWIATEWLRGTMFTGYPWDPLGVIWVPTALARIATLTGSYALSGMTILLAGLLLPSIWRRRAFPIASLAAIATLTLVGYSLAFTDAGRASNDRQAHVRVVQPDLGEEERPTDNYADNNLAAIERLLGQPGRSPRLIVWPEGALRFMVEDGYPSQYYWRGSPDLIRQRIARRLGSNDIVLTGGNALKFDAAGNLASATNSIFAIDAKGALRGRYDKAHLVPYGEYLPMRPILSRIGLQRLVPGDTDFAPGPGPRAITLSPFGDIGMQICYEIIFSGETVDEAHRPSVVFNPSNDSWYGAWGPPQHLAQARMRAIEEGLPVLRATPTGISAIIDADGRVVDSIPLGKPGAIEAPMPAPHSPTPFARLGNWAAGLIAVLLLLLAVALRRARR
ncbi:MAG: apolipoprotein N-acyltransferase [Sphingomonas sp.]